MSLSHSRSLLSVVFLVLAAAGVSLLAGCSGSKENPRVTFCRLLAAKHSGTAADDWHSAGNRFHGQEYVAVGITGPGTHQAVCYYEYDTQESGAVQMANPLLGYATVPYKMAIDGRVLTGKALEQDTMAQQMQLVRDVAKRAQQSIERAADAAGKAIQSQTGGQ